jgi:hypothetical protein
MMTKKEALQVLDGSMLGDGNLTRLKGGAIYYVSFSKPNILLGDHLKYLHWIADDALRALGVEPLRGYPKIEIQCRKGRPHGIARLVTHSSIVLGEIYEEWYTGGSWIQRTGRWHGATKVLPKRLLRAVVLPVLTLAPWFLEDGSSSIIYPERACPVISVSFSTYNFSKNEVYGLMGLLNNMGLGTIKSSRRRVKKGSGLLIRLKQDSVNPFMDLIEPIILSIFRDSEGPSYKDMIKRRPGACAGEHRPYMKDANEFEELRKKLRRS